MEREITEKHIIYDNLCLLSDWKRIQDGIDLLPDYIDLKDNEYFEMNYEIRFVVTRIMNVPDNITYKLK